ncbi:MAG: fibro-slime domain-containing protein [Planctomycetota bacterium]
MKTAKMMFVLVGSAAGLAGATPPPAFTVQATVRDFSPGQPDFQGTGATPDHVMGLVESGLGDNGLPVFTGGGQVVETPWLDENGNATAGPFGSDVVADGDKVNDFAIDTDGIVTVNEDFAVRVRVLGSAIETGSYTIPTTSQVAVDGSFFEPFGAYDSPTQGNLNDDPSGTGDTYRGPFEFVASQTFAAGSTITVDGRSWIKDSSSYNGTQDSHWNVHMDESTSTGSQQIFVLRDGDPVPNITAMYNQASVRDYVGEFIDSATDTITLESNEVIYLFELGTSHSNSNADFQDLVVLLDFAKNANALQPQSDICGVTPEYTSPVLGQSSDQGIASSDSFGGWFDNRPGVNAGAVRSLRFADDDGDGVYEYWDNDFTPINGALYMNDVSGSNRYFTMQTSFSGTHTQCGGEFIEVTADANVWVYINGELVIDLGGSADGKAQRVELDRLGLTSGEAYTVDFFYAQRTPDASAIRIATNVTPSTSREIIQAPSNLWD